MSKVTSELGPRGIRAGLMLIITTLGCVTVVNELRVEPGPTPNKPVFVLTDTTGRGPAGTVYGLAVIPCGSANPVWQVVASGSNGAPARFVYGDTLPGYITRVGPTPLTPGCYDVFLTDSRRVRFRVDASGRVTADGAR